MTIVAAFGNDHSHHFASGVVKGSFCEEGLWEQILDNWKEHAVVSKDGAVTGDRVCADEDTRSFGFTKDSGELGFLVLFSGSFVVAKGLEWLVGAKSGNLDLVSGVGGFDANTIRECLEDYLQLAARRKVEVQNVEQALC